MKREDKNLLKLIVILFIILAISVLSGAQVYEISFKNDTLIMHEQGYSYNDFKIDKYKVQLFSAPGSFEADFLGSKWFHAALTPSGYGRKYELPLNLSCYPGTYYIRLMVMYMNEDDYSVLIDLAEIEVR